MWKCDWAHVAPPWHRRLRSCCTAVAPLLQLTRLTELEIEYCHSPSEQLVQLHTLTGLQQLRVQFRSDARDDGLLLEAAASFGAPPLTHVAAIQQFMDGECLAHMGRLARVTCLNMAVRAELDADGGVTPEALAAAFACMTALQRLRLASWRKQPERAWTSVVQALAQLPRLTTCNFDGSRLGPAVAAHFTAVTSLLTTLRLSECDLDDEAAAAIIGGGGGLAASLRKLDVGKNDSLTDVCLAAIAAAQPRQLTCLQVLYCRHISVGAVQRLSAVLPWLLVDRTMVGTFGWPEEHWQGGKVVSSWSRGTRDEEWEEEVGVATLGARGYASRTSAQAVPGAHEGQGQ